MAVAMVLEWKGIHNNHIERVIEVYKILVVHLARESDDGLMWMLKMTPLTIGG